MIFEVINTVIWYRETANEYKQKYLIRQSFQEFRCKSDIAIFAWRFTWNYAYNPFKYTSSVKTIQLLFKKAFL